MKEISETYRYNPADIDEDDGWSWNDAKPFRDVIKGFERDFHTKHSAVYAMNLYANSQTMALLALSCGAAPFLTYGMDLTQGRTFDAEKDPFINHQMDQHSNQIYVYGIDSAYMEEFDEHGYPVLNEESEVYPLTLLIDDEMRDDTIRLATPTTDDESEELETNIVDIPKFVYA